MTSNSLARLRDRLRHVTTTDFRVVSRIGTLPPTPADRALLTLTRSANKSRLWFALAAVLAARKGATRRGALRGVAAIAGASATANLVGKPFFPRRRPPAELMPQQRRLVRRPVSSSFPSGHAASAAAFATAVTIEAPAAGLALAPLAGAVAYSRVHTGVHWPTDVAAGVAVGVVAGFATRHWWPLHPDVPARTAHRATAPVMRDGEDMLAVVNPTSGDLDFDPTDQVRFAWPKATLLYPDRGVDLRTQLTRAIADNGHIRALGVAGGDGTVAAVASVAADTGLPLALIPAGTLNHFARDVGVRSMAHADAATESGSAVGIDLGEVEVTGRDGISQRWFVNTASLGGYPEMVRLREKIQERHPKWPAMAIAMIRTIRRAKPLRVRLNGRERLIWMIFVGNGTYAPKGFGPSRRPALDTGLLDVRYVRADRPYSRLRFVLAALTKTLNASHVYRQYDLPGLDLEVLDGNRRLATDGEVGPLGHEFRFRARPSALTIYRP